MATDQAATSSTPRAYSRCRYWGQTEDPYTCARISRRGGRRSLRELGLRADRLTLRPGTRLRRRGVGPRAKRQRGHYRAHHRAMSEEHPRQGKVKTIQRDTTAPERTRQQNEQK